MEEKIKNTQQFSKEKKDIYFAEKYDNNLADPKAN